MPNGNFVSYAIGASVEMELAYSHKRGGKGRVLNLASRPCQLPYSIDFSLMIQTRHGYLTERDIKRVALEASLQWFLLAQSPAVSSIHSLLVVNVSMGDNGDNSAFTQHSLYWQ